VVASRSSAQALDRVLTVLVPRCQREGAELIVVRSGAAQRRRLRRLFPDARVVSAPPHLGLPELRQLGASRATGDILIVLDDTDTLDHRWNVPFAVEPEEASQEAGGTRDQIDLPRSLREYGLDLGNATVAPVAAAARDAGERQEAWRSWARFVQLLAERARPRQSSSAAGEMVQGS
jgi:hypothetical protein